MVESILSLIRSISTIIFFSFKDITNEEIEKNISFLKKKKWFQKFLDNKEYSRLIQNNTVVRKTIGSINLKKMVKPNYNKRQQKRLKRALEKQVRREKN